MAAAKLLTSRQIPSDPDGFDRRVSFLIEAAHHAWHSSARPTLRIGCGLPSKDEEPNNIDLITGEGGIQATLKDRGYAFGPFRPTDWNTHNRPEWYDPAYGLGMLTTMLGTGVFIAFPNVGFHAPTTAAVMMRLAYGLPTIVCADIGEQQGYYPAFAALHQAIAPGYGAYSKVLRYYRQGGSLLFHGQRQTAEPEAAVLLVDALADQVEALWGKGEY